MKALILNSGTGSRMAGLDTCKCLLELCSGTTIYDAQIESLLSCGISDIVVTTGAHAKELELHTRNKYPEADISFVHNPLYSSTNYVYSMFLARQLTIGSDIILMHGDLVFERNVLHELVLCTESSMVVDQKKPLPEKDFKAVLENGRIRFVGVDPKPASGDTVLYSQPLYKFHKEDFALWMDGISKMCDEGNTGVYAEDAFNNVSAQIKLLPLDLAGRVCFEVDNREDHDDAKHAFGQMPDRLQDVYFGYGMTGKLRKILARHKKPFIVCGLKTCQDVNNQMTNHMDFCGTEAARCSLWSDESVSCNAKHSSFRNKFCFADFASNPVFEDVQNGIGLFIESDCDVIVSFGGGSAIDIAKCINILEQGSSIKTLEHTRVPHICIPTTAGTGSESTSFAVVYKDGSKFSVEHNSIKPNIAILDPKNLRTLPNDIKESAMMDAYCQAIESLWSNRATDTSKSYANAAIGLVHKHIDDFLKGEALGEAGMLLAANLAGKAIDISKTTAPHAMSYKLSTMFEISHGHAVALCMLEVLEHFRVKSKHFCQKSLYDIDKEKVSEIFGKTRLQRKTAITATEEQLEELVMSVNEERLKNHPVEISHDEMRSMYFNIVMAI